MADTFLVVGEAGANVSFGTADVGYSAIGVIVSASKKTGGDKLEVKGRNGDRH